MSEQGFVNPDDSNLEEEKVDLNDSEDEEITEKELNTKGLFWTRLGNYFKSRALKSIAKIGSLIGVFIISLLNLINAFVQDMSLGNPFNWSLFWGSLSFASTIFLTVLVKVIFGNESSEENKELRTELSDIKRDLDEKDRTIKWIATMSEYRAVLSARDGKVYPALEASYIWSLLNDINKPDELLKPEEKPE